MIEIPVIDVGHFITPSTSTAKELEKLRSALNSFGCIMDGTVITFLLQDKEVEGLQILKEDQWFRVPIIPDALVLNIGEHLEIMSNGEFKSPIHRAVVNSERNRISLAVPSVPRDDTEIEPVEGLISEGQPRLYKKVKYSRSIHLHYYQNGKRIVDDARI
ncbi:Codeine O-demethylase [Linum perenne]